MRFRHNQHSLRIVERARARRAGSTSPSRCATASSTTRGRPTRPRLEGRIVRVVDRIAYINHDIDDAMRAGVIGFDDLPAGRDRGARRNRLRPHRDAGARPARALARGAATSSRASEVGGAMLRLREFMFEPRVPGPRPSASARGSSGCCAPCSTTTPTTRRPPLTPGCDRARARRGLPGRNDRPLRHPRVLRSDRSAGVLGEWRATPRTRSSVCARRWTSWRSSRARTDLRRVRLALRGAVPVPRGAHALVLRGSERGALLLLRLRQGRRRDQLRDARPRALDFAEAVELLAERYRHRAQARARGPPGGGAAPAPRAPARAARPRRRLLRQLPVGVAAEARAARDYLASRGLSEEVLRGVPGRLRPDGVGQAAHGRPARRLHRSRSCMAAGLAQRRQGRRVLRPLPRADHVPARRRRAAACWASARARCARSRAASTSTPPRASSTTRAACCSASTGPRSAIAKSGRVVVVEGYTDVLALHQAGVEDSVAIMGTALTERAARRAGASGGRGGHRVPGARRRQLRSGGDAAERPAWRRSATGAAGGGAAGGHGPCRARGRGGPEAFAGAARRRPCLWLSSRWGECLPTPTSTPPRAETARSRRRAS